MRSQSTTSFDDKQRMRRFVSSPLTLIALGALVVFAGFKTWGMYEKWRASEAALATARVARTNLEERAAFLDDKIERLGTEIGVEAEIRDRFGVAKPGEGVIVVLSDDDTSDPLPEPKGWWDRAKGWFSREN